MLEKTSAEDRSAARFEGRDEKSIAQRDSLDTGAALNRGRGAEAGMEIEAVKLRDHPAGGVEEGEITVLQIYALHFRGEDRGGRCRQGWLVRLGHLRWRHRSRGWSWGDGRRARSNSNRRGDAFFAAAQATRHLPDEIWPKRLPVDQRDLPITS